MNELSKEESRHYIKMALVIATCIDLAFFPPLLWLRINLPTELFLEFLPYMFMWAVMANVGAMLIQERLYVRKLSKRNSGITV
jgi:hypothetical protein